MNKKLVEVSKLLPVRTALFFVAGMLLCAEGGARAIVVTVVSALFAAVSFRVCRKAVVSAVALFVGALIMTCYVAMWVQPILSCDKTVQELTFTVTSEYENGGYNVYTCSTSVAGRPTSIRVYYGDYFNVGDVFVAQCKLSRIDYGTSHSVRKVLLNGSIEELHSVRTPQFSLRRSIAEFRQGLSDEISAYIDGDVGALAQGLLFGETGGFSLQLRHAAKVAGVMHFTAVSGSHFVIIMSVLLEVFGDRKKLRAAFSALCIPLAVLFFGEEPSVIRAGIMLFLCNCGPLFARKSESVNSLCVAVILMTAFTPYVVLDIGFQMSVLGVFGVSVLGNECSRLLMGSIHIPRPLRGTVRALIISACAVVCVAPISVGVFGGVSLVGVFATVLLTPIFSLALTFAIMFAVSGITPLIVPISLLMRAAHYIIMFCGSNSRLWLVMDFTGAELLALLSMLLLTVAVVYPFDFGERGLALFAATVIAAASLSAVSAEARRKVEFVSDGNGAAAIVCMKDEAMVYLCGDSAPISRIADILLENGIYHLRLVAVDELSTAGAVKLGGLHELYPIERISSAAHNEILREQCRGAEITPVAVQALEVDGITLSHAKAGDTECVADIVIYTGYKMSEPEYGARLLALYASSRQNILPDGAVNIYDTNTELSLEK